MRLGSVDTDSRVLVVAEIGHNHEGRIARAHDLISAAAACGVDAVKVQVFQTEYFVSRTDRARYDRLRSFELPFEAVRSLHALARSLGLLFIATPLDLQSADRLTGLVDAFKVASGDNDFYPLIARLCQTGRPLVISSGASDLAHLEHVKQFVDDEWKGIGIKAELAFLHCVSSYPAAPEALNLSAIGLLRDRLGCTIGYSDHVPGLRACTAAVAAGARIVEKHFTLDKTLSDFRDHQLSADPEEMSQLVREVAEINVMLGQRCKVVQESEPVKVIRRSIVAAAELPAGHRLAVEDLTWIRPAIGLPPGDEAKVVDRVLKHAVAFGDPILTSDLE